MTPDRPQEAEKPGEARCSCGDSTRPNINHRKRIPCWTYVGEYRMDVVPCSDGYRLTTHRA